MSLTISHTTHTKPPSLPYEAIARDILGAQYELSLTFIGDRKSRVLNQTYRKKDYTPNVLSFPLGDRAGEVYINPHEAKRQAASFALSHRGMIGFLFIHALLHLKGYDHSDTMDRVEARYIQKYGLS